MKRFFSLFVLVVYLFSFGLTFNNFYNTGENFSISSTNEKGCSQSKDIESTENTSCDKFYNEEKSLSFPQKEKIKSKKLSTENNISYVDIFSFLVKNGNNDPPGVLNKLFSNLVFTNLFGVIVSLE